MKVQFVTTDYSLFYDMGRDNSAGPWISLRKTLEKLGHEIYVEEYDDFSDRDCYVVLDTHFIYSNYLDYLKKVLYCKIKGFKILNFLRVLNSKEVKSKMILSILEPPSVLLSNYNIELHRDIKYVLTWDKKLIDNKKYFYVQSPYTDQWPTINYVPFEKRKLLVDVSSNKFSNHPDELYTFRRKLINYFDKNHPADFDLYGFGWNIFFGISRKHFLKNILNYKRYQTYKGVAKSKFEVFPKYKFVLCIENMKNIDDYISQRVFDIFISNAVPIYWGAKNISEYIPTNCFIDASSFNCFEDLYKFISEINEKEYLEYLRNINSYLKSESFKQFTTSFFVDRFCQLVANLTY